MGLLAGCSSLESPTMLTWVMMQMGSASVRPLVRPSVQEVTARKGG